VTYLCRGKRRFEFKLRSTIVPIVNKGMLTFERITTSNPRSLIKYYDLLLHKKKRKFDPVTLWNRATTLNLQHLLGEGFSSASWALMSKDIKKLKSFLYRLLEVGAKKGHWSIN